MRTVTTKQSLSKTQFYRLTAPINLAFANTISFYLLTKTTVSQVGVAVRVGVTYTSLATKGWYFKLKM